MKEHVESPLTPACNGKLPILTKARKLYAYGEQRDYFDSRNCIGTPPLTSLPILDESVN